MKILAALLFVFGSSAFAGTPEEYTCRELGRGKHVLTVLTLVQIGDEPVREGKKYLFNLTMTNAESDTIVEYQIVEVETEDVLFSFNGANLSGMIYLDEMDQSWLEIGRRNFSFNCELHGAL